MKYRNPRFVRFALGCLVLATPLAAQDTTAVLWTRHTIQSTKLGEQRSLYVALPDGYANTPTKHYPVLILLDANDAPQFNAAIGNVRFLASRNAIPALIVVGIPNGKDRTRDLTPKVAGSGAKDFPTAGGADAFADFMTQEALPLVRARYRTRPLTVFAGHSFGGLVALHIAATRPGTYAGIVAMSPSLWWNDSTVGQAYADAIARSRSGQRIFASSGGLETGIDVTTKRFAARLESSKGMVAAFQYRHYAGDSHGLTPAPSLTDGLRFVFEPLSTARLPIARFGRNSDSTAIVRGILESETEYARGARQFGEPESLPEEVLNSLGYGVLQALGKPALAVWIFRRNAEKYPESANVYDSLADALIAKGDTLAAMTELKRAVEIGTRTKHPVAPFSQEKLQRLEKATQAGKARP